MKLREHEMTCPHLKMGEAAVRFRAILWQSPLSVNILLHVQCPPCVLLCHMLGWLCWKSMVRGLVARLYWQLFSCADSMSLSYFQDSTFTIDLGTHRYIIFHPNPNT